MEQLIVIAIVLFSTFIFYKLHKASHKADNKLKKQEEIDELSFYKREGKHFRKAFDECFIIQEKVKEDILDVEAKDFRDYMTRPGSKYRDEVFIESNKTRISCYAELLGEERLLYKIVDYDYTVVQMKARMQGYIDLYIIEETYEDGDYVYGWFFDTTFLEKDLFE